jgi:hypothetical protein
MKLPYKLWLAPLPTAGEQKYVRLIFGKPAYRQPPPAGNPSSALPTGAMAHPQG